MSDQTKSILSERGSRYGRFDKHAQVTVAMKAAFWNFVFEERGDSFTDERGRVFVEAFTPDMEEAIDMIFHKLGRIANGDPSYADSWADIAGYARLVADRLEGTGQYAKEDASCPKKGDQE